MATLNKVVKYVVAINLRSYLDFISFDPQVCLYESWRDKYVSHDLAHTGLWEPHVLFDFQDVLRRDSSLGVIDIGANIGVYTLLAAAMHHQVRY